MAKSSFDRITNSWLYRACKVVGDVVVISALFLLFCLPVVTIGSSVTALYYTVYRKYHKKIDNISKDFIHSFKDNLKNGIIVHLLYLIYSTIVGFNIYFAFFGLGDVRLPDWYMIVSLIPVLPVIFSLPFFILIWLIIILALAISIGFPPAALITPAAAAYLCQFITEKAFSKAMDVERSREDASGKEISKSEVPVSDEMGEAVQHE